MTSFLLRIFLFVVLFGVAPTVWAGTNRFTAELVSKYESPAGIMRPLWHPSGKQVTYLRRVGEGGNTTNILFSYDVESRTEKVLLHPPITPVKLSLSGYQWSPNGDAILISGDDDLWLITVTNGVVHRLTHDSQTEELPTFSPDGNRVAFVKGNNLYTVSVKTGRPTQLTFDGSDTVFNGKHDWVYGEEFSHISPSPRAYEWSPDSRRIAFLRLDDHPVPAYPLTDFLRAHPTIRSQHYPKAGDTNPVISLRTVSVASVRPPPHVMPLSRETEYIPTFTWTPDSRRVAVVTLNRRQNELTLLEWQPGRARTQPLLTEQEPSWINVFTGPRFLKDGRFIWCSEKDGWYHAYLHERDGTLIRALTHGDWQIEPESSRGWSGRPFEVDEAGGWIYFSATERDPRERQLCRVRLDGSGFERLTSEPGTHFQKLSPDGRYLLENFSSVTQPPSIRLRRADGALVATLDQRENRWKDFAEARAEFHEVTAADGTNLFARLTKPADFNPARKYPVVVYVYGGPHAQLVHDQWSPVSGRDQLLAQEGFLVWSLDNRGSWGRGHAWETAIYQNLGARELADQLAGVAYLKLLPFVDTNRFGIWGWSYGGYLTLYALTHSPDTFKAGIAGAPVTDWKFYDTIYTERYMCTPKENPDGYKTSSPLAAADKLKAKLLVIHGTSDDNVHMQNSMNFLDALVKAGRPYELQIQPGQSHGFGGEAATRFVTEALVDFFKRNL